MGRTGQSSGVVKRTWDLITLLIGLVMILAAGTVISSRVFAMVMMIVGSVLIIVAYFEESL